MTDKLNDIVIILTVGAPCSGKSTWVVDEARALGEQRPIYIISRDMIREEIRAKTGGKYIFNKENEGKVTDIFYKSLGMASLAKGPLIFIDNTHCKQVYVDSTIKLFESQIEKGEVRIFIKEFDVPLWKCQLRNIKRWIQTGKWIPPKAITAMYRNKKKMNLKNYNKWNGSYLTLTSAMPTSPEKK